MGETLADELRKLNPWTDMTWPEKIAEAAAALEANASTIASLTAERDAMAKVIDAEDTNPALMARIIMASIENKVHAITAESTIATLNSRIAGMEKALLPFEEVADEGNEDQPDDTKCTIHAGRSICYGFTLADFRRIRAALGDGQ